jgi:dihydroorotate dehydrogenase
LKARLLSKVDHRLRPVLAKTLPHKLFINLYSEARTPFIEAIAKEKFPRVEAPQKPVELWGLTFRNDISNAAGFDKDGSLLDFNYRLGAGFGLVGTALNRSHSGNVFTTMGRSFNPWTPLPSSQSAINSLGLPGKGIDSVLDHIKSFQDRVQPKDFPIGLSVMGHPSQKGQSKIDGVIECLEKALPIVDFIEINESCPNVKHHDSDQEAFEKRIIEFCSCRDNLTPKKPLWVKFGSNPTRETLKLLNAKGVQGLVLLNTQTHYEELRDRLPEADKGLFDYYTKNFKGGVSGKIMQEDATLAAQESSSAIEEMGLNLKLIHVGGLSNKQDMDHSRTHAPLREWYTGFMDALSTQPWHKIYAQLF